MQNVILALINPGLFNGKDIERFLHNTDHLGITVGIAAEPAGIHFGDIVADGTQRQTPLQPGEGFGQLLTVFIGSANQMKNQSLG